MGGFVGKGGESIHGGDIVEVVLNGGVSGIRISEG